MTVEKMILMFTLDRLEYKQLTLPYIIDYANKKTEGG